MMGLAPYIGRKPAHDTVYQACCSSIDTGRPLLDVLRSDEDVTTKIGADALVELCDPTRYMGCAQQMVDNVLKDSGGQMKVVNGNSY